MDEIVEVRRGGRDGETDDTGETGDISDTGDLGAVFDTGLKSSNKRLSHTLNESSAISKKDVVSPGGILSKGTVCLTLPCMSFRSTATGMGINSPIDASCIDDTFMGELVEDKDMRSECADSGTTVGD